MYPSTSQYQVLQHDLSTPSTPTTNTPPIASRTNLGSWVARRASDSGQQASLNPLYIELRVRRDASKLNLKRQGKRALRCNCVNSQGAAAVLTSARLAKVADMRMQVCDELLSTLVSRDSEAGMHLLS